MRKSIFEWAVEYCGDPGSHTRRGEVLLEFLQEKGLRPNHRVLDLGCGALSQGKALINYLDPDNYAGLDPNGWLIEAALQEWPELEDKRPSFSYRSDFEADGIGPAFDYIISHSVLSHVADWQMDLALHNMRKAVNQGAIWLASLRIAGDDSLDRRWVYPGVSFFKMETVVYRAWQAGWSIQRDGELKDRLSAECPNDVHDWVTLTAILSPNEANEIRLIAEEHERGEREIAQIADNIYRQRHSR